MEMRRSDFALDEIQQAVHDTFSSLLQKHCPISVVRAAEPLGFDEKLWSQLGEARTVAMGVPEEAGGDGAGLSELAVVGELVGLHLAPVPFAETVVAARLLAADARGAAAEALTAALDNTRLITFAVTGPLADGRQLVNAGAIADAVVGLDGDDLVLVTPASRPQPVGNQGRQPLAWVSLGADQADRAVLASGAAARTAFQRAKREWQLLVAATMVGMTEGSLRLGCVQARERFAFGVPIGFFQGVSHRLVNDHIGLSGLQRLVRKAAWFADHEPERAAPYISMASIYGAEVAMAAATNAVHVLGGVGFTVEADAQLYFRRVKGTALLGGDPQRELLHLADLVLGPAAN
jgi:alkylation response protein AidB-like acyl-CoA dehydrogenase